MVRLSLHLSKCHIVGNHMSQLICFLVCPLVTFFYISQSTYSCPVYFDTL